MLVPTTPTTPMTIYAGSPRFSFLPHHQDNWFYTAPTNLPAKCYLQCLLMATSLFGSLPDLQVQLPMVVLSRYQEAISVEIVLLLV